MNVQNVLIIAEGPTDEHMLKPIITKMMTAVGKPHATIRFEPVSKRRGGVDQILKNPNRVQTIIRTNPMVDLFIVCVDRDCLNGKNDPENRSSQLQTLESKLLDTLKTDQTLVGECAVEEIEVWVVGGHQWQKEFPDWRWRTIRAECHPKEQYYEPFAHKRDVWQQAPGQGRKILAQQISYSRLKQRCREIKNLENRIRHWLDTPA
ncbi:MAG: hypothetical protein KC419_25555 [Anaerolineales bacterium]|nr:hypothetical protein [Anaerolineales bacterium]MCA9931886.1 hypothetical protein [Anaerolineales bacterium]